MEKYSNDAFLGFPVDVLGNNYYTVSHYPSEHDCEFLVVGVYDSTNVTIRLGTHPNITVRYNRRRYYSNDVIQLAMNRLDTMQVVIQLSTLSAHVMFYEDQTVSYEHHSHLITCVIADFIGLPYFSRFSSGLKSHVLISHDFLSQSKFVPLPRDQQPCARGQHQNSKRNSVL